MAPRKTQEKQACRSKRQIDSISDAMKSMDEVARTSEEGSNSPVVEEIPEPSSAEKGKKKVRGPSKLNVIATGKHDRQVVEFNELGQAIGDASIHLSTITGILSRECVPITYKSWDKVPAEIKDQLWAFVTQRFILEDFRRGYILGLINNTWRDFKSKLSSRILEASKGPNMNRHLALLKPAEVKLNEWEEFVKDRLSKEFQVISDKHKEARAKQMYPHTSSRKGYARLSEDMKVKKNVKEVRRVDVWLQGHTKKDGEPVNNATKETMTKIKECPTQESNSLRDDALTKVLGPERPGRVRGLGFGVTPTKVVAIVQSNGKVAALEHQLQILMDWKMQMETILSHRNGVNVGPHAGGEDVPYNSVPTPQSNQDSTHVLSPRSLANATCKLLNWVGTGEVVASAQIESTDPQSLVHHQILGPDCYKVWVVDILIPNVPVYRYSDVFSTLDDAKGSTIAWPQRYIKFD